MKIKTSLFSLITVFGISTAQAQESMSQEEFSSLLATFESSKSEAKTSVIMSLVYGSALNNAVCELEKNISDLRAYIDTNPSYAGAHYAYQNNIVDSALVQDIKEKYKINCD